MKTVDECLYCGEHNSADHTLIDCEFVKNFVQFVIDWFNAVNNSNFSWQLIRKNTPPQNNIIVDSTQLVSTEAYTMEYLPY